MDWYPWYFELYDADAGHLSCLEDGAYRRLIDRYMRTRMPLPDDDAALARFVGLTMDEWTKIAPRIRAFFRPRDGKLQHKRCNIELDQQDQRAKGRSESATKAAQVRWLKEKENAARIRGASEAHADRITGDEDAGSEGPSEGSPSKAAKTDNDQALDPQGELCVTHAERNANAMRFDATGHTQDSSNRYGPSIESPPSTSQTTHTGSPGRVYGQQAKVDQFDRFWQVYPKRDCGDSKKEARAKFAAAVKRGVDPEVIIRGAENYGTYMAAEIAAKRSEPRYIAMASTWLNQERWEGHQQRNAARPTPGSSHRPAAPPRKLSVAHQNQLIQNWGMAHAGRAAIEAKVRAEGLADSWTWN